MPFLETAYPIMAPALLKSVAEQQGHSAVAMDINAEIIAEYKDHPQRVDLLNWFLYGTCSAELVPLVTAIVNHTADKILTHTPHSIGLSLLTFQSRVFTRWLCVCLKHRSPNTKIIIGGTGIKEFIASQDTSWADRLRETGLVDHYIIGDGEQALIEYLRGNLSYPGIDSPNWIEVDNLDQYPYPNYSDYPWHLYTEKVMPIVDSRGCVRNCEFCDIIEHWKKYRYRSADNVFQEMLHQIQQHGITDFRMQNSLTNGNMREFNRLLDLIVEYNSHADKPITWSGYFIVRNSQQHPEQLWSKLARSGATLWLGVESVIQSVRYGLGKKFSNEDIDYHLEMAHKYNVPLTLLIIVAYPTETIADYDFTKKWLQDRLHYAGNPVQGVYMSYASVLPGTKLEQSKEEKGLRTGKFPSIWFNQNLAITADQREQYMRELQTICQPFNADMHELYTWTQEPALQVAKQYASEVEND